MRPLVVEEIEHLKKLKKWWKRGMALYWLQACANGIFDCRV